MMFWVFSTSLTSVILKKVSLSSRLILQSLILILILKYSGFLNFWMVLIPLFCVELSFYVKTKKSLREDTVKQLILLSGVILFHLLIYVAFDSFFKESLDLQFRLWFERIDLYWDSMLQNFGAETVSYKMLSEGWLTLLDFVPSVYFGGFILGFYSCFWGSVTLSKFKCPDLMFWIAIICFAFGFLNWDTSAEFIGASSQFTYLKFYQILFKNFFIVLSCLYFFQGLSVSSHLMEKFKIARFWQNLWYILIIFNLPMIIVFMGLLDFIFEFRSFKERK
jgi:hypothetical protein